MPAAWTSALTPERRSGAFDVARDVVTRVADRQRLHAAIWSARQQTNFPQTVRWDPFAVAEGDAGLATMCGYLDTCWPGERWDEAGHGFLSSGARAAENGQIPSCGLFSGLSGLAFGAVALSRDGTRYRRLLESLDAALAPWIVTEAERLASAPAGVTVSEFDLISGLSGVAAYLLCRAHRPLARHALDRALEALVALAEPDEALPRWWTPPSKMGSEEMASEFPYGNLNCGLAHGIPGPLAALAIAAREGIEVRGQATAVRDLAAWLVEHRTDDSFGPNWPSAVPVGPDGSPDFDVSSPFSRNAWCYGSPGVARSLWLAGDALGDADLRGLAVEALEAVFRRPPEQRLIDSPTFCHGVAGLLQITLRFAHDTHLPVFAEAADALVAQLLEAYEPERILGYASVEPGDNQVDRPGVLDGTAGVAMVLLAAATDVEPTWDRLFLLA